MDQDLSIQKCVRLRWKNLFIALDASPDLSCQNFDRGNIAKKLSHLNTFAKCSPSAEHLLTHLYCYYDIIFPDCVKTSQNDFTKLLVWILACKCRAYIPQCHHNVSFLNWWYCDSAHLAHSTHSNTARSALQKGLHYSLTEKYIHWPRCVARSVSSYFWRSSNHADFLRSPHHWRQVTIKVKSPGHLEWPIVKSLFFAHLSLCQSRSWPPIILKLGGWCNAIGANNLFILIFFFWWPKVRSILWPPHYKAMREKNESLIYASGPPILSLIELCWGIVDDPGAILGRWPW